MVSTATPPPRRDRSDSEWSAAKGAEGLKRREVVSPDRKDRNKVMVVVGTHLNHFCLLWAIPTELLTNICLLPF